MNAPSIGRAPATTERITLAIEDLASHGGTTGALEPALAGVLGVRRVHVNRATEMAYIVYDPARCTPQDLVAAVAGAGYQAGAIEHCAAPPSDPPPEQERGPMDTDHSCCTPAPAAAPPTLLATDHSCCAPAPAATPPARHGTPSLTTLGFRWRLGAFGLVAILVLGGGLWLALNARMADAQAMYRVDMSMSGFQPPRLVVPARQAVTVQLNNVDSPFHAITNGALHQFAIDALAIDVKLDGRQSRTITLPALAPGTYEYYCNVCCGGRVNPAMQGTLVVQ